MTQSCPLAGSLPLLRRTLAVILTLLMAMGILAITPANAGQRGRTPIDAIWRFMNVDVSGAQLPAFDDSQWQRVALPHTYNGGDGDDGGSYYRGPAWYRTDVILPASEAGRSHYLEFDGATLATDLWVNGHRIGRHEGGFARFRFDVSDALKPGRNSIAVRVDNSKVGSMAPLGGDFTVFGGLNRRVWLVATDQLHFDMMQHGGPGIAVSTPQATKQSALIRARVRMANDSGAKAVLRFALSLRDAAGLEVARTEGRVRVPAGQTSEGLAELKLSKPHLWNGVADPYLYTLVATLADANGGVRDRVELPFGIRTVQVTSGRGVLLNEKPYRLHGVNYFHAQRPGRGTAVTDDEVSEDMQIIAEMGVNAVRFVHFQHPQRAYEEADRLGLLVWTEIPLNGAIDKGEAFQRNIIQQMQELIAQNAHHPSVAIWGLGNEVYEVSDDVLRVLRAVQTTAHAADPTRPTSYAHCCQSDDDPKALVADIGAFNRYFGWYPDQKGRLGEWARNFHAAFPQRAFAIGEYGAGGGIRAQESDPAPPATTSAWHPEQYQTLYHERNWREIRGLDYLWGSFVWVAFDLASDGRSEGDHDGINDKGLVTYDRAIRKDAYFWYQANWSDRPMLHLTERRHTYRTTQRVNIRAYSNQSSVRLTVNGSALPEMPVVERIAAWSDVVLQPGPNVIEISADGLSDKAIWVYDPDAPIMDRPTGIDGDGNAPAARQAIAK